VEVGAGVQLDDSVLVANPDGTRFDGGSLVVSVAGATADDNLQIVPAGSSRLSGNQVFRAGVPVWRDRVGWFEWLGAEINFLSDCQRDRV
jgi:hypothetical protein